MEEIRVNSWTELNERLYENSWQAPLARFRSNYVFRGMPDLAMDLRTSLIELSKGHDNLEVPLLRAFRRYAHGEANPGDLIWNWLAIAQHHGLPTRLLDWSYSPYVALHFATDDLSIYDRDGVIWCVDYVATNQYLPEQLKAISKEEDAKVFTAEMLARGATTLTEFDRLSASSFVVFLEPPSLDDRIVNQFALFSLMSNPKARFDFWLQDHPELSRKIIIPAPLKGEVRDKLDQANITERVLFPGLDGLSLWIKRYYTPKPN